MKELSVLVVAVFLSIVPLAAQSASTTVPGLGTLTMATSARSDSAQRSFLRGVLLLHLFEYSRAAKAFREAEKVEPDFAMAYWGEAMTYTHPVWNEQDIAAGRAALARLGPTPAARAEKAPTTREKAYLGALDILYGDGPKARRDTLYSEAPDRLVQAYPDDNQAHLFYALSLLGLSQGVRVVPTYLRAAAIADTALTREPHNPGAAHYLIHGVDDPGHASQGLKAARVLLETASDAGHGQHMASHIFMALGMWDDVVAANENAVRVVDEQAAAAGRPSVVWGHYASWLEYGYLSQGRVAKARAVLSACHERAAAEKPGAAGWDPDNSAVGSYVMMWARYLLDTGDWDGDVAKWNVDTSANPYASLTDAFVRGFGSARRGDAAGVDSARTEYGVLEKRLDRRLTAQAAGDPGAGELVKRMEVLGLELEALWRDVSGDEGGVVPLLERATTIEGSMAFAFGPPFVDKPSSELLGEVLLAQHHPQRAGEAFRASLKRAKLCPRALLGLARASAAAGDVAGGARAYGALTDVWHAADAVLPGLSEARAYVTAHPVSGGARLGRRAGD